jgi:acetoin utilization deacetylase AcuC-like enzyme
MKVYYHDLFTFPLPEGHRFPIHKYAELRERLLTEGVLRKDELFIPEPATDSQLLLAHSKVYIGKVITGALSSAEIRRLGFPWSQELVERSRRSVGSTIAACRAALSEGVGVNLGGGTHHAHAEHGEGFCVFNDVAVAARVLQAEGLEKRVVILDCDVHQGDGTAAIFSNDPTVYTMSIHGEKNFPFRKQASDLDIALPDNTGDGVYLDALGYGVRKALESAGAGFVIYLAGADPFIGDRLGRLSLTKEGLAKRDQFILGICQKWKLPLAIVMGGGYAKDSKDITDIHIQTIRQAINLYNQIKFSDRLRL